MTKKIRRARLACGLSSISPNREKSAQIAKVRSLPDAASDPSQKHVMNVSTITCEK
jgi:hypothetical protein